MQVSKWIELLSHIDLVHLVFVTSLPRHEVELGSSLGTLLFTMWKIVFVLHYPALKPIQDPMKTDK